MNKSCDSIIDCPEEKVLLFTKNGHPILECKTCGHRFTKIGDENNHITEVYADDYFFGGKAGYPNYLDEKDSLYKAGMKYAKIISKHKSAGEVLDVGCAAGFILKGFEKAGWHCHGIEPNDTMAGYGRKELQLDIQTGTLETIKTDQKFDLINLIQVVGHFYDLDQALVNVKNLLNQDGLVLVESWNMKSNIARLLGKNWQEYSPPSVVHWFSDKTLTELFRYYGFELIESGRPSKKISVRHALNIIDGKLPKIIFKKGVIKFFNRLFGKSIISYPPFDLKWYLFRKL